MKKLLKNIAEGPERLFFRDVRTGGERQNDPGSPDDRCQVRCPVESPPDIIHVTHIAGMKKIKKIIGTEPKHQRFRKTAFPMKPVQGFPGSGQDVPV
jgi:hypothetical protein